MENGKNGSVVFLKMGVWFLKMRVSLPENGSLVYDNDKRQKTTD